MSGLRYNASKMNETCPACRQFRVLCMCSTEALNTDFSKEVPVTSPKKIKIPIFDRAAFKRLSVVNPNPDPSMTDKERPSRSNARSGLGRFECFRRRHKDDEDDEDLSDAGQSSGNDDEATDGSREGAVVQAGERVSSPELTKGIILRKFPNAKRWLEGAKLGNVQKERFFFFLKL